MTWEWVKISCIHHCFLPLLYLLLDGTFEKEGVNNFQLWLGISSQWPYVPQKRQNDESQSPINICEVILDDTVVFFAYNAVGNVAWTFGLDQDSSDSFSRTY